MGTSIAITFSGLLTASAASAQTNAPADTHRLAIRALDGQLIREIPLIGASNHVPMWSPNGKEIGFQVREHGRNYLAVVQSDGTGARLFRDALSATNESARWSPDSRYIGFLDPARHDFRLLNVATGEIRTVSSDSTAQVGVWMWRPDGRSIVAVMTRPGPSPGLASLRRRVDEITLDGKHRTLLDTLAMRGVPGVTFVDPYNIFVRHDSAAYRIPLDGGSPQRIAELAGSARPPTGVHTTAPVRDIWAGLLPGRNLENGQIEVISVRTGERRMLSLPFRPLIGPSPGWTRDGSALIVAGRPSFDTTHVDSTTLRLLRAGDSTARRRLLQTDTAGFRLYRVPIDGDPPRVIAIGRSDGWTSASPDGKWVAYGVFNRR